MTAFADYTVHRVSQAAPDNDGGLITMTSPTTVIGANIDTGSATVPFGFTFDFDGTSYTQGTASTDGWLIFSGSYSNPYQNDQFDDSRNVIGLFPWWGDLRTAASTGYVRYEQFGSAPERYVVIEWRCYAYFNHSAIAHRLLPFQLVLRESSNNIEYRYGTPTTLASPASSDGVIGARIDTTGTINGNLREFTEKTGTPDPNGGVSTLPVELALSWAAGGDFPGDPANSFEGAAFNFHFRATAVSPGGGAGGDAPDPPPASSPGALSLEGAKLSGVAWDVVPPFVATYAGEEPTRPNLAELVWISIFSWARAEEGDELPTQADRLRGRNGWWAESYGDEPTDRFGSRLWLLQRAKATAANKQLAIDYTRDALAWLVADGLAAEVDVALDDTLRGGVGLTVTITRGDGEQTELRYSRFWERLTRG
jgi:phage gp46-like protein